MDWVLFFLTLDYICNVQEKGRFLFWGRSKNHSFFTKKEQFFLKNISPYL